MCISNFVFTVFKDFLCLLSAGDVNEFQWSTSISIINDNEQFVRIPYYGDIRLTIINNACTTFLIIDSVSQVSHGSVIFSIFLFNKVNFDIG